MQVLGPNFIQTFMMPYMMGTILNQEKIESNPLVQKIFAIEMPLDIQNFDELIASDNYFRDTGTIFDQGQSGVGHKKVFWNEFTDFIHDQQKVSGNNIEKLAFRTLPDAKTGVFSQLARENILKFCMHMVKAVEEAEIKKMIDVKELNGDISKEAAALDRVNLSKGKLLLAKGADGKDIYLSEDDIKNALGDVTKRAQLLKKLQIRQDSDGVYIFLINPVGIEDGSTLREVQAAIWQNQKIRVEKKLAKLGLDARDLQVDRYGVLRGGLRDVAGTETIVEVDLEKPGQTRYRLTMANNSSVQIWLTDGEMQNYFTYQNKTISTVFEIKQSEEKPENKDIPTRQAVMERTTDENQRAAIKSTMETMRDSKSGLMLNVSTKKSQESEKVQKTLFNIKFKNEIKRTLRMKDSHYDNKVNSGGIMTIKAEFQDRNKNYQNERNYQDENEINEQQELQQQQQQNQQIAEEKQKAKDRKKKKKNKIFTVLKLTAASFGGVAGIGIAGASMFN